MYSPTGLHDRTYDLDLRGSVSLGPRTFAVEGRLWQVATGRLRLEIWSDLPGADQFEFLAAVGGTLSTHALTTADGSQVQFEPAAPLISNSNLSSRRLALTLSPSRVTIGDLPAPPFTATALVPNFQARVPTVMKAADGLTDIEVVPLPATSELIKEAKREREPVVTCIVSSAPLAQTFADHQRLMQGVLNRISLACGSFTQPVAWEVECGGKRYLELIDSSARPMSAVPLLPETSGKAVLLWYDFQEQVAAVYEGFRGNFEELVPDGVFFKLRIFSADGKLTIRDVHSVAGDGNLDDVLQRGRTLEEAYVAILR